MVPTTNFSFSIVVFIQKKNLGTNITVLRNFSSDRIFSKNIKMKTTGKEMVRDRDYVVLVTSTFLDWKIFYCQRQHIHVIYVI